MTDLRPSDPVRPPVPERVPDPAPVADPGRPALVVDTGAEGLLGSIGARTTSDATSDDPILGREGTLIGLILDLRKAEDDTWNAVSVRDLEPLADLLDRGDRCAVDQDLSPFARKAWMDARERGALVQDVFSNLATARDKWKSAAHREVAEALVGASKSLEELAALPVPSGGSRRRADAGLG
ncbi:MAG: hypothetical protein EBT09_01065, partial [Actinobacteria bacterium]|nr:hypothetical protein [Actinomycetota bacterium]